MTSKEISPNGGPNKNGEANGLKRPEGTLMNLNPKVFKKFPSRLNKNNELILKIWIGQRISKATWKSPHLGSMFT
jgi:hypothetical protein